jgi:hypothetical protein
VTGCPGGFASRAATMPWIDLAWQLDHGAGDGLVVFGIAGERVDKDNPRSSNVTFPISSWDQILARLVIASVIKVACSRVAANPHSAAVDRRQHAGNVE